MRWGNRILLLFPSMEESFGLELAEAMAAGCPIAASDLAYAHDVAGEAAVYFDPRSPHNMARTVINVLQSPALADVLRAEGAKRKGLYSYEKIASSIAEVLEQAVPQRRQTDRIGSAPAKPRPKNSLRILHVIHTLDPFSGGPGTAIRGIVREQVRRGHEVAVLATSVQALVPPLEEEAFRRRMAENPAFAGAEVYRGAAYGRRGVLAKYGFSPPCAVAAAAPGLRRYDSQRHSRARTIRSRGDAGDRAGAAAWGGVHHPAHGSAGRGSAAHRPPLGETRVLIALLAPGPARGDVHARNVGV